MKTRFFRYDFHPHLFPFDEAFKDESMDVLWAGETKKETPEKIIASVGLGLKTSIARGPNREPEEVWQVKVPIVTAVHT